MLRDFLPYLNYDKRVDYIVLATFCTKKAAEFVANSVREFLDADIVFNLDSEFDQIDRNLLKNIKGINCDPDRYSEVVDWI